MAYVVDRVVICDAFEEPARHYELLTGGRSKRVEGRRPSMRFLASARDTKGGIAGVVGKQAGLFDDLSAAAGEHNKFVNQLRLEVRGWREAGYPDVAVVTRRLLEWWFERDEERKAVGRRFFFCQQEAVEAVIYLYEVQGPATFRRLLGGWRDLVVINDEAHHVYGEKRTKKGEDPEHIKWSKILERIGKAARVSLVIDLSATPWYGSGSPKPEGTLFEWLVADFSVYDAFESGLVKVVRLPDPDQHGRVYLDLWDDVKGARTKEEYLRACKGAIASIYSSWRKDYDEWSST